MQELILISSFHLAASLALSIAAVRIYFVVRKKKSTSIAYFFYGLSLIALYLFTKAMPGIILEDGFLVYALSSLFRPILLLGGMFFCLIPFRLLGMSVLERLYIGLTLLAILIISALNYFGLEGKEELYRGSAYWIIIRDPFLDYGALFAGIVFALSLLTAMGFYAHFTHKKRKSEIAFGRALMITVACFFLFGGAATSYIIGTFVENHIAVGTVSSLFYIMGAVVLVASVNYKGEKKLKSN